MRHYGMIMLVTMLFGAMQTPAIAQAETTKQISQFGFTWTFAEPVTHGQFANGDYWVVGPVKVVSITPKSVIEDGRTLHGSMVNPGLGMKQGYDSAMYGNYGPSFDANMNVAAGVSEQNPLTLAPGSSLISSQSIARAGNRPQLETAAILTVLDKPAPEGSFRPPYIGDDKTITYNIAQLDYTKLPRLSKVEGTPDINRVAGRFERPWLEHVLSWTGRYCHPRANMPDYGRDMALVIGDAVLLLMLDYTDEEKQTLLIRLVQYGLDLHAIAKAGGKWDDLGGHMHGRKLPIMLAGHVLGDADMVGVGKSMPNRFQEDRQTFYVKESDVGRALHRADNRPREQYIAEDVGVAEWGEQHTRQPNRDGRNWNAPYRTIVGHSILAHVLVANMLDLREKWDHEALFDYIDRYWEREKDRTAGSANIPNFHKNMWRAYRQTKHAPDPG